MVGRVIRVVCVNVCVARVCPSAHMYINFMHVLD